MADIYRQRPITPGAEYLLSIGKSRLRWLNQMPPLMDDPMLDKALKNSLGSRTIVNADGSFLKIRRSTGRVEASVPVAAAKRREEQSRVFAGLYLAIHTYTEQGDDEGVILIPLTFSAGSGAQFVPTTELPKFWETLYGADYTKARHSEKYTGESYELAGVGTAREMLSALSSEGRVYAELEVLNDGIMGHSLNTERWRIVSALGNTFTDWGNSQDIVELTSSTAVQVTPVVAEIHVFPGDAWTSERQYYVSPSGHVWGDGGAPVLGDAYSFSGRYLSGGTTYAGSNVGGDLGDGRHGFVYTKRVTTSEAVFDHPTTVYNETTRSELVDHVTRVKPGYGLFSWPWPGGISGGFRAGCEHALSAVTGSGSGIFTLEAVTTREDSTMLVVDGASYDLGISDGSVVWACGWANYYTYPAAEDTLFAYIYTRSERTDDGYVPVALCVGRIVNGERTEIEFEYSPDVLPSGARPVLFGSNLSKITYGTARILAFLPEDNTDTVTA